MWSDGEFSGYGDTNRTEAVCKAECDKYPDECAGFDYYRPTGSCLFRGGKLPDLYEASKEGLYRRGNCSNSDDFHHALLPAAIGGTCKTIGKVVESIARIKNFPIAACQPTDGSFVLFSGTVCNVDGGILWDSMTVVQDRLVGKTSKDCTFTRAEAEANGNLDKLKFFGQCGEAPEALETGGPFLSGLSGGGGFGPFFGYVGHYLLKGETKCEVSLSKRQCRMFAKLRGFQFSLSGQNYNNPEGQDAKFQQNIPTLPSGCYINEGTVEWNRNDNAHTCYNTHSDDDSSTIACVCAVPVPSSACSLNCPETKLEQISLDGDCGDGDLDDSNRQEFLIPNTPTHPGTLEGARGMCAKFCSKLEKQSWEREKCKYFSVSSNLLDGAEDKCYQEFLPDDCLSYEQNTNSKQTYKLGPWPHCSVNRAFGGVAIDYESQWSTHVATPFYEIPSSAWKQVTIESSNLACKLIGGHLGSTGAWSSTTSLQFRFLGRSLVRCDITIPYTFVGIKGSIAVTSVGASSVGVEGLSGWGMAAAYQSSAADGMPCPYGYAPVTNNKDCGLAASQLQKTFSTAADDTKIHGCFLDTDVYFNSLGFDGPSQTGKRVCASIAVPTPSSISLGNHIRPILRTDSTTTISSSSTLSYGTSEGLGSSSVIRIETSQSTGSANDFDVTVNLEVLVHGESGGELPSPRHSHSLFIDNDFERNEIHDQKPIVYMYGGRQGNAISGDLYAVNVSSMAWTRPTVVDNGQQPGPTYGHRVIGYKNSMISFGGCCHDKQAHNEVYSLDLDSMTWTRLTVGGSAPDPRMYHSFVRWEDSAYVFGGVVGSNPKLVAAAPCARHGKRMNIIKAATIPTSPSVLLPFVVDNKEPTRTALTYETWIRTPETFLSSAALEIIGGNSNNPDHGWYLKTDASCGGGFCQYLGQSNFFGSTPVDEGVWYHLAVTMSEGFEVTYYLNGQIDASKNLAPDFCIHQTYVLAPTSYPCPDGYVQVSDKDVCNNAAGVLLPGQFNGVLSNILDHVAGCITYLDGSTKKIMFNEPTEPGGTGGEKVCEPKPYRTVENGNPCPHGYKQEDDLDKCKVACGELSSGPCTFSETFTHDHHPGCIVDSTDAVQFNLGGTNLPTTQGKRICKPCIANFVPSLGDRIAQGIPGGRLYNFRLWKRALTQAEIRRNSMSRSFEIIAPPYGPIVWLPFHDNVLEVINNQAITYTGNAVAIGTIDVGALSERSLKALIDVFDDSSLDCTISCVDDALCFDAFPWKTGKMTWGQFKTEASNREGRLPTLKEGRSLSADDPLLSDIWIAVQNHAAPGGKDWMQLSVRNSRFQHGVSYFETFGSYPSWGDDSKAVFTPRSKYFAFVPVNENKNMQNLFRLDLQNYKWKPSPFAENIPPSPIQSIVSRVLTLSNVAKYGAGDVVVVSLQYEPPADSTCEAEFGGENKNGMFTILKVDGSTNTIELSESLTDMDSSGHVNDGCSLSRLNVVKPRNIPFKAIVNIVDKAIFIASATGYNVGDRVTIGYQLDLQSRKCQAVGSYTVSKVDSSSSPATLTVEETIAGGDFDNSNNTNVNNGCRLGRYVPVKLLQWTEVSISDEFKPSPRHGHSAVVNHGTMYVFGGYDGKQYLNDVQTIDLEAVANPNVIQNKWRAGVSRQVSGRFLYLRSTKNTSLTVSEIQVINYYGENIAVGVSCNEGVDCLLHGSGTGAQTPNPSNKIKDGDIPSRVHSAGAGGFKAYSLKTSSAGNTNDDNWLRIEFLNKFTDSLIHKIKIWTSSDLAEKTQLLNARLYITDEAMTTYGDPSTYSLKWVLNGTNYQEYVVGGNLGNPRDQFEHVCASRKADSDCTVLSAAPNSFYRRLDTAMEDCLSLPSNESALVCNAILEEKLNDFPQFKHQFSFLHCPQVPACNGAYDASGKSLFWLLRARQEPLPRSNHSAVIQNGAMYVFGGWNGANIFDDTWIFDTSSHKWSEITSIPKRPSPRFAHASILLFGRMVTFGGLSSPQDPDLFADTNSLCTSTHRCSLASSIVSDPPGNERIGMYYVDEGSLCWPTKLNPNNFWTGVPAAWKGRVALWNKKKEMGPSKQFTIVPKQASIVGVISSQEASKAGFDFTDDNFNSDNELYYHHRHVDNTLSSIYGETTQFWKEKDNNEYSVTLSFQGRNIRGYKNTAVHAPVEYYYGRIEGNIGKLALAGNGLYDLLLSQDGTEIKLTKDSTTITWEKYEGESFSDQKKWVESTITTLKHDNLEDSAGVAVKVYTSRVLAGVPVVLRTRESWKGTVSIEPLPVHHASACNECVETNDIHQMRLYSTSGCEANCVGCTSHETCIVCREEFYLINGNCFPRDVCPYGTQRQEDGMLPERVCLTCGNGFSYCTGFDSYLRPGNNEPSYNDFVSGTHLMSSGETEFQVSQGLVLGQVKMFANFNVTFQLRPGTASRDIWSEILRFSSNPHGDCCEYGDIHVGVYFAPSSLDVKIVIGNTLNGHFHVIITAADSQLSADTWSRVQIVARGNKYFLQLGSNETHIVTNNIHKRPAPSKMTTVYASRDPTSLYSSPPGNRISNRVYGFFYPFTQIPTMGTAFAKKKIGQTELYSEFRIRIKIRFTEATVTNTDIAYFSSSDSGTGDYYPKIYVKDNEVCAKMKDNAALCDDANHQSRSHNKEEWHAWEYTVKAGVQTLRGDSTYKTADNLGDTSSIVSRPGYVFVAAASNIMPKDLQYEPLNYAADAKIKDLWYNPL